MNMIEKDKFWNIDRILPKSKTTVNKPTSVKTTEISTGPTTRTGVDVRTLISAINEKKSVNSVESSIVKEFDYQHFSGSRVISYAYVGKYNNVLTYDTKNRAYALSLFEKEPSEHAEFVEYLSFKPSFQELVREQLDYYLYWRSLVRRGEFQKTSSSYVLLCISEIINLPDKIPPPKGLELIISLFDICLDEAGKYERIISDVLFEYCLVHNIAIPYEKIAPIVYKFKNPISNIIGSLFVFDYMLNREFDFSEKNLRFIFERILGYSYSNGKHYSENEKLSFMLDSYFYKTLGAFLKETPECITQIYSRHENISSPIKVIHPTFLLINASSEVKKNIVFEYSAFYKTDVELLYLLNIAKCIENKFRSQCGIRARLSVASLEDNHRLILDKIFEAVVPDKNYTKASVKIPQRPNNKKVEINFSSAKKIEEESWETTRMLTEGVEAFSEDTYTEVVVETTNSFSELEIKVLNALIKKDVNKATSECVNQGVFLDAVVMAVNEKAFEIFNDVIIDNMTMSVYDDYVTDVEKLLN